MQPDHGAEPDRRGAVSILYEADRLCNRKRTRPFGKPWRGFNPLRGRQTLQRIGFAKGRFSNIQFQSSTRQTDFATFGKGEALRCLRDCFNPLRGRQTLQPRPLYPLPPQTGVSILYEADRLCNGRRAAPLPVHLRVSILYEADRLCNGRGGRGPGPRPPGFNPLRGRQTLQHQGRGVLVPLGPGFNPLRGRQTLQPAARARYASVPSGFQSSTRQTDFATRWPGRIGRTF